MGRERVDRTTNPLAAMMEESTAELEREGGGAEAAGEMLEGSAENSGRAAAVPSRGGAPRGSARRAGRGRPRGGRNSDPNCVPISAKINREVRFAMDRVLAEQSEQQGRPVYMAEVIERLMRFYCEHGDPYERLAE